MGGAFGADYLPGSLPAGWLMKLRQVGWDPGFCPGMEGLENRVPRWLTDHSPFGQV